jgi:hypothetical protein
VAKLCPLNVIFDKENLRKKNNVAISDAFVE